MGAELLAGGMELLGQGLNAFTQGLQNRANQRRAERMFQWEVNANRENWRMQNEYNSPAQQMQRLKEAGLNPNLVYGNGATATGGSISSSSANTPQGQAPRLEPGRIVSGYLDAQLREVQIDQGKASVAIMEQDKLNKALQSQLINAQIQKLGADTESTKFGLSQSQRLADYSVEAAKLGNQKTAQDIQIGAKDYVLRELQNGSNLKEALTRMALNRQNTINAGLQAEDLKLKPAETRQRTQQMNEQTNQIIKQIELMQKDGTLKDLEIQMRKSGLNQSDPTLIRLINQFLTNL